MKTLKQKVQIQQAGQQGYQRQLTIPLSNQQGCWNGFKNLGLKKVFKIKNF